MLKDQKIILGLLLALIVNQDTAAFCLVRAGRQFGARILDFAAFNPKKTALVYGMATGSIYYNLEKSTSKTDRHNLKAQALGLGMMGAGALALPTVSLSSGLIGIASGLGLMVSNLEKTIK